MVQMSRSIALLLALCVLSLPGFAQMPKVGAFYKDTAEFGFHVKVPDGWKLIPPSGDDPNLIAKYTPAVSDYVLIGADPYDAANRLYLNCWLLKFERRGETPEEEKKGAARFASKPAKDIAAWLKSNVSGKLKADGEKPFKCDKIEAVEYQYTTTPPDMKNSARYFICVFKLKPDVDIAMVFNAPGDPKKWNKWEAPFTAMTRSFGAEDMKAVAGAVAAGDTLRDKKRAELNQKIAPLPGWKLYETPNYFVLTPHEDRAFVQELLKRLEAIRAIYEQDYPAAKAEELKKVGEATRTGGDAAQDKAKKDLENEIFNDGADPREMSKCSVVRVFTDKGAYHSYGGPGSSAGYWSPMDRELVLYDDQAGGGRGDTWAVLNHEAFHQYIFYFYGAIAPHSWYNEGTGDYYSGFEFKNGKFKAGPSVGRKSNLKDVTSQGRQVPLRDFVRWSKAKYYGQNDLGMQGYECYAQGWSLIWFLRTGQGNAKGWQKPWGDILDRYLETLLDTGDLDKAIDKAFEGVDWKAFESSWLDYVG